MAASLNYVDVACPTVPTLYSNCSIARYTAWCTAYPVGDTRFSRTTSAPSTNARCYNVYSNSMSSAGIEAVAGLVVTQDTTINLSNNSISSLRIADNSGGLATVKEIELQRNRFTSLANLQLPPSVTSVDLSFNAIESLVFTDGVSNVQNLDVSSNPISRVDGLKFPSSVVSLCASNLSLAGVDTLGFPPTTKQLDLSANRVANWSNFVPPRDLVRLNASSGGIETLWRIDFSAAVALERLDFTNNRVTTVEGVKFPASLRELILPDAVISMFTLRQSDIAGLSKLTQFRVKSVSVVQCTKPGELKTTAFGSSTRHSVCVLSDADFDRMYAFSDTEPDTSSSLTLALAIVGICVAVVVVLALATLLYKRRKLKQLTATRTTRPTTNGTHPTLDNATLLDDIRSDTVLAQLRIDQKQVTRVRVLAKGGFGIVYLAKLGDRDVVTKQLLPEKAKDPRAISGFVAEIRLCAGLTHPRIVTFVGITWSTLADLAIVLEYMPHGDLAHLLKKHRGGREPFHWLGDAAQSPIGRTKLALAIDVAEALVYLHAASIVHRDLKAQNVLLSGAWEAKLTDFGVSREVGDEMTAEVGTVAWIAPEVLKGEDYGAVADVYSFGVVMAELDTCDKPYATGIPDEQLSAGAEPSNTRIALAVVERRLRPGFRADCPAPVLALAQRCLSYTPSERPSAQQLLQELLAISSATDSLEGTPIAV